MVKNHLKGCGITMKRDTYNLCTPFIIDTDIESIEEYIDTLSPYGKRHLRRGYRDYKTYRFLEKPFSPVIYGQSRPARSQGNTEIIKQSSVDCMLQYLNKRESFKMFTAVDDEDNVAGHIFLETFYHQYATSSCPISMLRSKSRYFSYYMWRNIIEYCINSNDVKWLNVGESKSWISDYGGKRQPTWRRMLLDSQKSGWTSSFSLLLPKHVKDDPREQGNYIIVQCKQCRIEILHDIDTFGDECNCNSCNIHHVIDNQYILT